VGELRDQVIGADVMVPTLSGSTVPYVNLDNAATTPAMCAAHDAVERLLTTYGSVHRGAGHHARQSTMAFELAREVVGAFVGADHHRDVVVFTKNTTEAINRLARSLPLADDAVVLTTVLEHHSNDLPWRSRVQTVHVGAQPAGTLDLDDVDRQLARYAGRVGLLVVSGASNVTGVLPPIHDLAERYLYLMHMVQHLMFSLVGAPLLLLNRDRDRRRLAAEPAHVDLAVVIRKVGHRP